MNGPNVNKNISPTEMDSSNRLHSLPFKITVVCCLALLTIGSYRVLNQSPQQVSVDQKPDSVDGSASVKSDLIDESVSSSAIEDVTYKKSLEQAEHNGLPVNVYDSVSVFGRSVETEVLDEDNNAYTLYSGSYALLVGVWDYDFIGRLSQIPTELDAVRDALTSHGFEVTLAYPKSKSEAQLIITQFIDRNGFGEKNRIVFFYSGHGYSHQDDGYLLMKDAATVVLPSKDHQLPEQFFRSALTMNQIVTWATDMRAKHAMFLFDSCFSGTVFSSRSEPNVLKDVPLELNSVDHPTRLFITAGSATEDVPAKSDFIPAFIETLSSNASKTDINKDGYITGDEIGLHIKNRIQRLRKQTPQVGKYPPRYSKGDIVFELTPWKPVTPAKVTFKIDRTRRFTLRGKLASTREKEAIVSAAERVFGIENISFDGLQVSADVAAALWIGSTNELVESFSYLSEGRISIEGIRIEVDGEATTDNAKKRLLLMLDAYSKNGNYKLTHSIGVGKGVLDDTIATAPVREHLNGVPSDSPYQPPSYAQDQASTTASTPFCGVFDYKKHKITSFRSTVTQGYRVRGQPHDDCTDFYGLTRAGKVRVVAQYGNWYYIKSSSQQIAGWVHEIAFEKNRAGKIKKHWF